MKTGVPPTAPKARTGELTPPGVTAQARANSPADRGASLLIGSSLASVSEELEQADAVRQRMLPGVAQPLRGAAGAAAGRRRQYVTVPAVPAQARHLRHGLGLAVKMARPTFVLVGGSAPGQHEEQNPGIRGQGDRAWPYAGTLQQVQRGITRRGRNVEHVEHPAGGQDDVRLRPGQPLATHCNRVSGRLYLPRGGRRVRAGRRAAEPVTRAGTAAAGALRAAWRIGPCAYGPAQRRV